MSMLPDVTRRDSLSPRQLQRAARAQQNTELETFQHSLAARFRAECDRIDTYAVADALRTALDEEIDLLAYGMRRAAGSAAKAELVARKAEMLSTINNSRIARRFGG